MFFSITTSQQAFVLCLQKTSWSRRTYWPWSYVFKTSWSRPIYLPWSYIFKTSLRRLPKRLHRHLQEDILQRSFTSFKVYHQVVLFLMTYFQDVFKTCSRLWGVLQSWLFTQKNMVTLLRNYGQRSEAGLLKKDVMRNFAGICAGISF